MPIAVMVISCLACYPAEQQKDGPRQHQQITQKAPPEAASRIASPHARPHQNGRNDDPQEPEHSNWYKAVSPDTWPSWIVVLAALGGILAAIRTLASIKRQADIMEEQAIANRIVAEAARTSSEALIDIERAWVEVYLELGTEPHVIEGNGRTTVSLKFRCANFGKTPAWISTKQIGMTILSDPIAVPNEIPNVGDFALIGPELLEAGKDMPHSGDVTCEGKITGKQPGLIYGRVTYRDIFFKHRTTTFGYWIHEGAKLQRLPFVYPAYCQHT